MKIKTISFVNHNTGWEIRNMSLSYLTLFVGASGVGKTKILRAIYCLSRIAAGDSYNGIEWNVTFECHEREYRWSGEFVGIKEEGLSYFERNEQSYPIKKEKLSDMSTDFVVRTNDEIIFNGKPTVKLDTSKSIISLLKEEDDIKPVFDAFRQIYFLKNDNRSIRVSPVINKKREQIKDAESLHDNRILTPIEKLFVLRKNELNLFESIKQDFISIFPLVEDIDFTAERFFDGTSCPVLRIKERGVSSWIYQDEISSGMIRTLSQITMLALAQDGDVILIDEFENGLGVNCIDRLTDQIKDVDQEVQVIMTSHHPYIINHIPVGWWKVVTRSHSMVSAYTAEQLHIGEYSKHEAFMQLIQTDAFTKGQK